MRPPIFSELLSGNNCSIAIDRAWTMMEELYPICRSITGNGVRTSLRRIADEVPLTLVEVPSGTKVFDWEVPLEWNVGEAWVEDGTGRRVIDFAQNTLHLMSYSTPVDAIMPLAELKAHLHSLEPHPDWIPYRTSYYKEDWGFCMAYRKLQALPEGNYRVRINSTLSSGSLTYGEMSVKGSSEDELVIFTHVCHPSLCNDNLTGIAIATELARALANTTPELTIRFVFAPGTIGSITWLARNEMRLSRIKHALVVGLLGDSAALTYKKSQQGSAGIDRIASYVMRMPEFDGRVVDFSPYGYDERQLCSPGIDLPAGRLTRSSNGEYPEYHSSADDFSIISRDRLSASLRACATIIRMVDSNRRYLNLSPKCEPRLGKRGLYRPTGGANPSQFEHALLWVLNQSNGERNLLDIAERSSLPFELIRQAAEALVDVQLLAPEQRMDTNGRMQ